MVKELYTEALKNEVLNPEITFETAVKNYIKNKFAKGSVRNTRLDKDETVMTMKVETKEMGKKI